MLPMWQLDPQRLTFVRFEPKYKNIYVKKMYFENYDGKLQGIYLSMITA